MIEDDKGEVWEVTDPNMEMFQLQPYVNTGDNNSSTNTNGNYSGSSGYAITPPPSLRKTHLDTAIRPWITPGTTSSSPPPAPSLTRFLVQQECVIILS